MEVIRAVELTADGVTLEPLRVDHADEMVAVLADPSIYAFIGGVPPTRDELRDRYESQSRGESPDGSESWLNWIIRVTDTAEAAGYVQASVSDEAGQCVAEIAWVVGPPFQGRRIATSATRAMCQFLGKQGVAQLRAHVHPDHPASQGVARAAGLRATDVIVDGEVRWIADVSDVPAGPDANTIVGLLADADRRRVLAAIELGATTLDGAIAAAALPDHRVAKALGKLIDSGVVATTANGFVVDGDAIARAARTALQRPPRDEHAAEPADIRKVLDAFVRGGRITSMPTSPSKRRVVLDWLARRFEPGRRYPESAVNEMLDGHAGDPVALRRYLVDETFLDRANGVYWRAGGTVDVDVDVAAGPEPSA